MSTLQVFLAEVLTGTERHWECDGSDPCRDGNLMQDRDNPVSIPYSQKVSLPVGSTVTIRGKANNAFRKEPRMQVDFHTGPTERSDIAFSFQVYFGKFVIMNSFQNPGWGPEVKFFDMPFAEDTQFELCISALDNEYQVSLNGKYYHSFAYRMPLSSVQMIQVWRDVFLDSLVF
ncbi:galectin-10-like [Fukomys damarensis]|uniref:galectin-10-like n=1 Tax=Fukomys damarensis TaxID=885580 RepID=UPI001455B422|nr:galectin-10-like [Fukomys damarensis]